MNQPSSKVVSNQRFISVILLNLIITVGELLGGIFSGSLSLTSDAFHNFSDSLSVLMGLIAQRLGQRSENERETFGYKRAEIISAFLNSLALLLISLFLSFKAVEHLFHPSAVHVTVMFWVAIISFIGNIISTFLLHPKDDSSLNVKATYLHLLSDTLAAMGVIVGSIIIYFWHLTWIDPLLTILISIYLLTETIPFLRESCAILMQASPNLDYDQMSKDINEISDVTGVHHIHAWQMDEFQIVLSLHVTVSDNRLKDSDETLQNIRHLINDKYHVSHVTIQIEREHGSHGNHHQMFVQE